MLPSVKKGCVVCGVEYQEYTSPKTGKVSPSYLIAFELINNNSKKRVGKIATTYELPEYFVNSTLELNHVPSLHDLVGKKVGFYQLRENKFRPDVKELTVLICE